jgi:hypothetical protein
MANIRLKKTESTNRQKDSPEETQSPPKDESFLDNSSEDELTRKRKMILTGITAGVGVAGATAAGLLFFGPYSPFGVKSPEKTDNLVTEQNLPLPPAEEKTKVQVPQPVITEQAQTVVAATPQPMKASQPAKAPNPVIAVAPVAPTAKPSVKKEKPVAIAPSPKAIVDSSGPSSYNYDIQDGGPILEVPSQKKVTVSRDPRFNKIYLNGNSNNSGKYRISIPPPGDIYWKEEGKASHKITINPPTSSGIRADFPGQLKMNETLNWSATGKVSFYRVEIASDADFLNRVKVFSTSKTSFPVESIGQGKWFLRISALNLQSGSWDSSRVFPINVGDVPAQVAPVIEPTPEKAQEPPQEEIKETPKELPTDTSASVSPEDSANKPVEPVNPVEAIVPDAENPPAPVKADE